jgi:hypothetical protein
LLSKPIMDGSVIIGYILASTIFSMVLIMPLMVISVILKVIFTNRFLTGVIYNNSHRIVIARSDFLSASYSNPPVVVLLSSSVKLPVKFVSDIPMPSAHPPSWILPITMISPLTYPTDFLRMGGTFALASHSHTSH